MNPNYPEQSTEAAKSAAPEAALVRRPPLWRKAIPYLGTALIFAIIFYKIPLGEVAKALEQVPVFRFVALFFPFCVLYWLTDSYCLTWVVRRFNAPMRYRDILPIRASMYLLSLINTNLGQGGVAYYLYRKARIPFLEALGSILFIAVTEVYGLFLFSTAGVIFYSPSRPEQREMVAVLRTVYVVAWVVLFALMGLTAAARRRASVRRWVETSRAGGLARTFVKARPRDYAIVFALKAPGFLFALVAHFFALSMYGIRIPLGNLIVFLPLVFMAAALPIAVAHLGTSQAAWLVFFAGSAPEAKILAYSLAAHFVFMACNGVIGVFFLPRASRELTAVEHSS